MKYILAAAFLSCTLHGYAQFFPSADYPRDYFRDPLAIPMSLAANFGELRPNHYHMGLDIRTQHRENLPVFAAADGYVARVSVEPAGFGQAIYIYHPNGYTTVYGHLNKFFPALAAYVHDQQYRRQSWQVALELPPSLFPTLYTKKRARRMPVFRFLVCQNRKDRLTMGIDGDWVSLRINPALIS